MAKCLMVVGRKSSKPNPVDPDDYDIDVECGQEATWCTNDEPDVCQACKDHMAETDPDIAASFSPA